MTQNNILTDSKIAEITLSYSQVIPNKDRIKIINHEQAIEVLRYVWDERTIELYESFKVILLNRNNRLLGVVSLSEGGIAGTVVDLRLLFAVALKTASSSIIIAHNHPSGNLNPSDNDRVLTKRIMNAGDILDVKLLDHLIITKEAYFSFIQELSYQN